MCGIAGFTTKGWSCDARRIEVATSQLIHRGPDQQGTYRSYLCALGGARLKILDLSSGDQPIYSADRDAVIVFNGEIYNHLEIRAELESRGRTFATHCDTETVLQAFLEWDTNCFSRLRGMFAIAIWQNSASRLVLCRDRLGIKPLYVARRANDLFFASELKGILVHPEIDRRLSPEGLDCYLSLNYVPAPYTLVQGIEKLPAGTWMEWQDGDIRQERYWTVPKAAPSQISFEDAKTELDGLLQRAVREHLLSDVPLGVWLSGGMDSSTMLHYASEESAKRLKTFSIGFNGQSFDESPYIREMVRQYGTEHEQLNLDESSDLEDAILRFGYYSDEPSADSGALPVWFLSQLTRASATVAFSGEGADEIFGGYLTYRANALSKMLQPIPAGLRSAAVRAVGLWPKSDEKIGLDYKIKRLLEGSLLRPEQSHVYWNGTFSAFEKSLITKISLPGAFSGVTSQLGQEAPGDGLSPYLEFDQKVYLPDDILVKSDRMSMAHSVEVRPPFLDHRIVEFAATLPPHYKVRGAQQKVILKQLMKTKLPPSILRHGKTGFDIPAHQWFRGPLRSLLLETIDFAASRHSDAFDFEAIRALVDHHLKRRINIGYHLWGLMILFLWMKEWNIQSAPSLMSERQVLAVEV